MAGKAINYSLARVPRLAGSTRRGLAAEASAQPAQESPVAPDVKCTVMPNKLLVSSLDLCGPLSRVTLAFKIGSRNETPNYYGITHVIRSMVGFSTQKCSGFAIVRNMQQNGLYFTCVGDREVTAFNVVGARDKIISGLKYLAAAATAPMFKPWQVRDNLPRLYYDLGCLTPHAKLMDNLHRACFRTGLGNSLFINKEYIGDHTPAMLSAFYNKGFTANHASLSGYNVEHRDMIDFAKALDLGQDDFPSGNSKYFGGEIRKHKKSYFAHIAVATQGVGLQNIKDTLAYSVLQHAYGVHPSVRWGGSASPLYKATFSVAPDAGVSCFNISYSDTGLFGVVVSSSAATAGKAIAAAVKVLKSGSVTANDVNRAKAMLKMNILSNCECTENIIEDMSMQSLNGGIVIPGPVLAQAIDKITVADVSEAAKKIAKGKLSLCALGDLNEVPYLDELS